MGISSATKVLLVLWLLFLTGASVTLWLRPAPTLPNFQAERAIPSSPTDPSANALTSPTPSPADFPSQRLDAQWHAALATIAAQLNHPTPKPATPVVSAPEVSSTAAPAALREVVIPLGSGNSTDLNWTPLYTAEFQFDPAKYGAILSARWEAAGSIVSGEFTARLVDVTHSRTYHDAILLYNSSTATWKRSGTLTLSAQPATYRVEVRSSNGERAHVHEARLILETR